jgi:hypothetical protein
MSRYGSEAIYHAPSCATEHKEVGRRLSWRPRGRGRVRQAGQRTRRNQSPAVIAAPIVGENRIGIRLAWFNSPTR